MKKLYLVLFFILCLQHFTKAQGNPDSQTVLKEKLNQTTTQFAKHSAYHPIEKIYLHLNKPWYNMADTVWFKAYTVVGNHKLTNLSEVAYVLLVNSHDSVLKRVNLKLHSGMASGHIQLPVAIAPGTYHIKAYTNWMCNEDENYIFDRPVNIGGIASATPATATATATISLPTDIQFFPEGGSLVNGLRRRVAFKATNPDGTPANVQGTITDADGNAIAEIQTGHDGMGVFAFMPQEGKTYHATIQVNGKQQNIQLPTAEATGYGLTVNNRQDTLFITVTANPQLFNNKTGHGFYLITQAAGKIISAVSTPLINPVSDLSIPTKQLPSGIVKVTLFSEMGEPLNERIVFVKNSDVMSLNISAGKNSYAAGEKINLPVTTGNNSGQPVIANLSAAVINEAVVPADEAVEPTIFSQLLLSSELHGNINNPAYYFANKDEKTSADLDLLMLTQGYRKLEWKKLLDTVNKVSPYFAEESLSISGTVKTLDGKPVIKGNVSLFSPIHNIAVSAQTDSIGKFIFTGFEIADTASIIVKATTVNNDNKVNITLDYPNPKASIALFFNEPPLIIAEAMKKSYAEQGQQYKQSSQLKEVNIKDRKNAGTELAPWQPTLTHSDNLNGAGHANQVIMGSDLGNCIHLADCLAAKIAGITVYPDGQIVNMAKGHDDMLLIAKALHAKQNTSSVNPTSSPTRPPFEIIVDGTQISGNTINNINSDQIYSVEVLTSNSYKNIYGMDAAGGVLLITTKRGGDYDNPKIIKTAPGIMNYVFNGYTKTRTFYTPQYIPTVTESERSAIYWNPDMVTDKDGKAKLEYTNAGKGNYRLVIEGIDNDGNIGRFVYRYKVE